MTDESAPQIKAPAGTCDCHIHVYDHHFPTAPTAVVTPPDASVEAYLAMCKRLGIQRTIVVQPSAYGKDSACSRDHGGDRTGARGIAVVDETVTDAELSADQARCARHPLFHAARRAIATIYSRDHGGAGRAVRMDRELSGRWSGPRRIEFAKTPADDLDYRSCRQISRTGRPDHPGFKALLRFDTGRTWFKLAAPYEPSKLGPPYYADVGKLAKLLVKAAPERALWASNWPYPMAGEKTPKMPGCSTCCSIGCRMTQRAIRCWSTIRRSFTGIEQRRGALTQLLQQVHQLLPLVRRQRRERRGGDLGGDHDRGFRRPRGRAR